MERTPYVQFLSFLSKKESENFKLKNKTKKPVDVVLFLKILHPYGTLISDCRRSLLSFEEVTLHHAYHEYNFSMDLLKKVGNTSIESFYVFAFFRSFVVSNC